MSRDDVSVEISFEECGECTVTLTRGRYVIALDFRSAGMTERLGPYCKACADMLAARIRDGLPKSIGTAGGAR